MSFSKNDLFKSEWVVLLTQQSCLRLRNDDDLLTHTLISTYDMYC